MEQRTLAYLGSLVDVWFGVPAQTKARVERRIRPDWKMVDEAIRRIPLTFEELSEERLKRFRRAVEVRPRGYLTRGTRERVEGEPAALAALSYSKFRTTFRKIGERRYRMN